MICTILSAGEELQTTCQNEEEPPLLNIQDKVLTLVQALIANGYDSFYVNGDYGVPLWAAECIIKFRQFNRIALHILIPYEEQATDWNEASRDRYFAVCEAADRVKMMRTRFSKDCDIKANKCMIDESDALVICGKEGSLPDALVYAKARNIRVAYYPVI